MKRIAITIIMIALGLSLCACRAPAEQGTSADIFVTDTEKEGWRDPLEKLLYKQQTGEKDPASDRPSIEWGNSLGLFDINADGVPELLVDMGGGSAGNAYFYVYDIFSGEMIGQLDGDSTGAWGTYYDIGKKRYLPIGRYDWRIGAAGSEHYISTVEYDQEKEIYREKILFFAAYEYDQEFLIDENGNFGGVELTIAQALYQVNGEEAEFQRYHYAQSQFYREYSFVPGTGLVPCDWYDVQNETENSREDARKMAEMLLFGTGQKFVKPQK